MHGTTILRAATRKMTSIMNINKQKFSLPCYSNISSYATAILPERGVTKSTLTFLALVFDVSSIWHRTSEES